MKTKFLTLIALFAVAALGRTYGAAPALCCAAAKPAAGKSCCAAKMPVADFTARSLYQLDAKWTNDAGRSVQLASFRGRPVVMAMFFASCEYACPIIVSEMKRLRDTLPTAVREQTQFVLVTFDSARDTPPALEAYRERMALDGAWTLLHGAEVDVQELAMLLGVKYRWDASGQFSHSNLITVLNPEGEIAHQRTGLQGDVTAAAQAVAATLAKN
jgi:protein SCO1/2